MNFDLGGGTFVLPSVTCHDPACLERRRYDRDVSKTANDIQANGELITASGSRSRLDRLRRGRDKGKLGFHSVDLGSGSVAGNFVRDEVCLTSDTNPSDPAENRCFPLAMLVAQSMADMPCALEPYDGTIGLGLQGMSLTAEFNFLAAMHNWHPFYKGNIPNAFGLHLGATDAVDAGEITFGGYDLSRLGGPLEWVSVVDPDDGFWQVEIAAVRIGNHTMEACGQSNCRVIIYYGSSLLSVPKHMAGGFEQALDGLAAPSGFGDGCRHESLPDLQLILPGEVTLTLPSEDFITGFAPSSSSANAVAMKTAGPSASCGPRVSQHDLAPETKSQHSVFVLGEATLRRYYTFFNADELKVGFSLARGDGSKKKPLLAGGKDKGAKAPSSESGVILLVQLKIKRSKTMSTPAL